MFGTSRTYERNTPLDSIKFNILMEIAQYIGVIQLTLKAGISHDKRHLAITSYVRDVPNIFWRIKWYGTLCANKQNSVQGVPGFEVVHKESRWRNRLSFFLT
jgi:hypothetical protein